MLTGHGNDLYDHNGEIIADFSTNIPYRNASKRIADYLANHLHLISNYPDPNARKLRSRIALHHHLSEKNVLVTNGSAEAFYLLAQLFANKRSTITFPAFAEYEDACSLYRHELSFLPIEEMQSNTHFNSDTVWFAVPNNPDGTIIPFDTIETLFKEHPQQFFIIDNAYGELCQQCPLIIPLHQKYPNFISVHSLTKTFAIPGLRLGYIIAHESVIERLQPLRAPWTVNAMALEAGSFVMKNYSDLLPDTEMLCVESAEFQHQLAKISQVEVMSSSCNYFLARLKKGTGAELKSYLIEKYGILIRDASNFRGLSPAYFRLSVQEKEKNEQLIKAIESYLKH